MSDPQYSHGSDHSHEHDHEHGPHGHVHTHGAVDPSIITTQRGIWAVKWSFVGLFATAVFQLLVVVFSGSVGLLADTIHNIGDAATAIPLWIAFRLARWKPNNRFTYGYGRVEDLAGVAVVFTILFSAIVAGRESVDPLPSSADGRVPMGRSCCIGGRVHRQRSRGPVPH